MTTRPNRFSVEDFSEATGTFPPAVFMGFDDGGPCPPVSCATRNQYVAAFRQAEDLAVNFMNSRRSSLYPASTLVSSRYATFCVQTDMEPLASRWDRVMAEITGPGGLPPTDPNDMVIISGIQADVPEVEQMAEMLLCRPEGSCMAFGARLQDVVWVNGNFTGPVTDRIGRAAFGLRTKAYNVADYSTSPPGFLEEIEVCIRTTRPSVPRVTWDASQPCICDGNPCNRIESTGCLFKAGADGCYEVRDLCLPCGCNCDRRPILYEVDMMQPGVFDNSVKGGLVSLMNTLLPFEACIACDPLLIQRWRSDNGFDSKGRRDAYTAPGYRNAFGIPKPGAVLAQKALELASKQAQAVAW